MEKRNINKIEYSRKFLKSLQKLPQKIIRQAECKEKIFRENCFDAQLKTHKLKGENKGLWAFWIDYRYRIKFIFINDNEVLFLHIGTHDIYK
jgi:mRNA-degrading endonuclease YafQ of YafQ-DinJ toxin-antitoxin module